MLSTRSRLSAGTRRFAEKWACRPMTEYWAAPGWSSLDRSCAAVQVSLFRVVSTVCPAAVSSAAIAVAASLLNV